MGREEKGILYILVSNNDCVYCTNGMDPVNELAHHVSYITGGVILIFSNVYCM